MKREVLERDACMVHGWQKQIQYVASVSVAEHQITISVRITYLTVDGDTSGVNALQVFYNR